MRRLIDRLFKYESIDGHGTCPTYLHRWRLSGLFGHKVYLHHFVGDDWALDPHDHPKNFISIGLAGEYNEHVYSEIPDPSAPLNCAPMIHTTPHVYLWRAPWFRKFPAEHIHRITITDRGSCWTICIVGRPKRPWGSRTGYSPCPASGNAPFWCFLRDLITSVRSLAPCWRDWFRSRFILPFHINP